MMCNGWSVRAHSGDALTEGGQCHVTCVRPRSEAAAVLGASDRGRTAPRHMRPPHITCVRPRSEAVAWGTFDRGRTVPRHLSTRLKSKKRTCSLCDTPFYDTHRQTVTLLSTPTPPVEFWDTHTQTDMGEELGNYVHQNPPRSSFGTDRHTVHTDPPVEFRDRQTERERLSTPTPPPFGTDTHTHRVTLYGGGAR